MTDVQQKEIDIEQRKKDIDEALEQVGNWPMESVYQHYITNYPELMQDIEASEELVEYLLTRWKEINEGASIVDTNTEEQETPQEAEQTQETERTQSQEQVSSESTTYQNNTGQVSGSGGETIGSLQQKVQTMEQNQQKMFTLLQRFMQDPQGTSQAINQAQVQSQQPQSGGNGDSPNSQVRASGGNSGNGLAGLLNKETVGMFQGLLEQLNKFIALSKSPDQGNAPPPTENPSPEEQMNQSIQFMEQMTGMMGKFLDSSFKVYDTLGKKFNKPAGSNDGYTPNDIEQMVSETSQKAAKAAVKDALQELMQNPKQQSNSENQKE